MTLTGKIESLDPTWDATLQLFGEKKFPHVIANLRGLIDNDPTEPHFWTLLGDAQLNLRKFSAAVSSFTRALSLGGPQTHVALAGIGNCYLKSGRAELALDQYAKAAKFSDDYAVFMADALARTGELAQALKLTRQAISDDTKFKPQPGSLSLLQYEMSL